MDDKDYLTGLTESELIREYENRRKQVPPPTHHDLNQRLAIWGEFMRVADEMQRRFASD
jgi:hypothetical protein